MWVPRMKGWVGFSIASALCKDTRSRDINAMWCAQDVIQAKCWSQFISMELMLLLRSFILIWLTCFCGCLFTSISDSNDDDDNRESTWTLTFRYSVPQFYSPLLAIRKFLIFQFVSKEGITQFLLCHRRELYTRSTTRHLSFGRLSSLSLFFCWENEAHQINSVLCLSSIK